ncbi:MAG TPA: YceI family protein [Gemmatimonadales bacterium]|nr:YceI family protein [Gemmatimonadales bacterium]
MSRYSLLLGCLVLAAPAAARAQTRWTVDSKSSLAWWQMSPNLNHLWATTCPGDSSWRPGEGRSTGWYINPRLKLPKTGYAGVDDTIHVPLYPRTTVYPLCVEALRGEIVVPDTVHWRGVHGRVTVLGDALITGEMMRDVLMHQVMQTSSFPEVVFTIDSVTNPRQDGDTLRATAVGSLTVRGIVTPTTAQVRAFHDAGGMRVLAKFRMPATSLLELTPRIHNLGLGVSTNIWHDLFMGTDLVLRPEGSKPATQGSD